MASFEINDPSRSRCLSYELIHNLDRPLELGLIFRSRLRLAGATPAALGPTIHPHEILAPKGNASIETVNILAPLRTLDRDGLQDRVQLVEQGGGMFVGAEGLWDGILQRRSAVGSDGGGDVERRWLVGNSGDSMYRAGSGRGEASGDSWSRVMLDD